MWRSLELFLLEYTEFVELLEIRELRVQRGWSQVNGLRAARRRRVIGDIGIAGIDVAFNEFRSAVLAGDLILAFVPTGPRRAAGGDLLERLHAEVDEVGV